jgi:hypothetical protein
MANSATLSYLIEGLSYTDSKEGRALSETCNIVFATAVTDPIDAQNVSGLTRGVQHRDLKFLFIDNVQFTAESGNDWTAQISYLPLPPSDNNKPATNKPKVTPYKWDYTEVVEYDKLTGDAFLNPAGDPLDPPFIIERSSFGFRIQVAEKRFSETKYAAIGSVNASALVICGVTVPAYCARLDLYDPKPAVDEKGYPYFIVDYEVAISKKTDKDGAIIGFKEETLNQGFNYLDAGTKRKIFIKDVNDEDIEPNEPQLLDSNGAVTTTPSYTIRAPRPTVDFRQFNLPSKFPVAGGD